MENNINFDKTRYIELLKKEEILKNEGTSLFNEDHEKNLELLSYSFILENQIYYNRKTEYIFLVEEYLRENVGEDGAHLFVCEFLTFDTEDTYGITLDRFHDSIQKIYLKIQNNNQE